MNARVNLWDHLEFVRIRVLRAVAAYAGAAALGFAFAPRVTHRLMVPEAGLSGLVFLSPTEALIARIKLALALGLLIGLPFILYQVWGLFVPVMDRRARRVTLALIPLVYALFVAGVAFALTAVLPLAVRFLLGFGGAYLEQEISVGNYLSFVIAFTLPFGLLFELPVLIVALARLGILRHEALVRQRKYALFGIFVIAAVLTPPDVVSQLMLAAPVLVLYEASILLARLAAPKRAAPGEGEDGGRES